MATVFKELNTLIPISDSVGSHLTNAADKTQMIHGIYLHNTHTSSILVTVYKVPDDGGSVGIPGAGNQIAKLTLDTLETFAINDISMYLADEGDSIQAVAATASKVNIFIEGAEIDT